jgi:hypothetical protein
MKALAVLLWRVLVVLGGWISQLWEDLPPLLASTPYARFYLATATYRNKRRLFLVIADRREAVMLSNWSVAVHPWATRFLSTVRADPGTLDRMLCYPLEDLRGVERIETH